VKHVPNSEKKPNCSSLEIIQHVLEFIVDLAQDQVGVITRCHYKLMTMEFEMLNDKQYN
jgi:hypothetical protein